MSFKCGNCGEAAPRRFSPVVLVTETRPAVYSTTDPLTGLITIVGQGTEIAKEITLCPECNGADQAQLDRIINPPLPDFSKEIAFAHYKGASTRHLRDCDGTATIKVRGQKVKVPCSVCVGIAEIYAKMTPQALSAALSQH